MTRAVLSLALMLSLAAAALPVDAQEPTIGSRGQTMSGPFAQQVAREAVKLATGEHLSSNAAMVQQDVPISDIAWADVRTLKPGTDVLVTVRGSQPGRRVVVRATDSELAVLNLTDPALPQAARRALRDVVARDPDYVTRVDRRGTFVIGDARVAPDGVFVGDKKVADLGHIVERIPRDDLVATVAIRGAGSDQQQAVTSFAELLVLLKRGDPLVVTDANGRTTKGKLGEMTASSLELLVAKEESDGRRTFVPQPRRSEQDVTQIQIERPDTLLNGILIGAGVGALVVPMPVLSVASGEGGCSRPSCQNLVAQLALAGAGIGAGIGAAIDWARKPRVTVYRAPGTQASEIRVAPLLSRSVVGVQVAVGF